MKTKNFEFYVIDNYLVFFLFINTQFSFNNIIFNTFKIILIKGDADVGKEASVENIESIFEKIKTNFFGIVNKMETKAMRSTQK